MQTLSPPQAVAFGPIALKLDKYFQWYGGHLTMLEFLVWRCPDFEDFIRIPQKSPKMAIFGLGNLCAVTKSEANKLEMVVKPIHQGVYFE